MSYFSMFDRVLYDVYDDGNRQLVTNMTMYGTVSTKQFDNIIYYQYVTIPDGSRPDNLSQTLYDTPDYYWTFFVINDHLTNSYTDWPKSSADIREFVETKYPNVALTTRDSFGRDNLAGKLEAGELVRGQISNARGYIIAKYPTLGYLTLEPISGTFRAAGEAIIGASGDSIIGNAVIKEADAPEYHEDLVTGLRTEKRLAGTRVITKFEHEVALNNEKSFIRVIKPEYINSFVNEFKKKMQG